MLYCTALFERAFLFLLNRLRFIALHYLTYSTFLALMGLYKGLTLLGLFPLMVHYLIYDLFVLLGLLNSAQLPRKIHAVQHGENELNG
jgi:hypothetical protein